MKIHWYDCLCIILYNSSKYGLPDEFVKNAFVNLLSGCHLFPSVKRDLVFKVEWKTASQRKSIIVVNCIL